MTYSSEVLADSPLLYWRLGDASGTTAADSSGNSRAGTYNGSPTLGTTGLLTGDADTAVTFDGVNDYVSYAGVVLTTAAAMSVELWLNVPAATAFTQRIFDGTGTSTNVTIDVAATTGALSGRVNATGTGSITIPGPAVADGVRRHVVLTYASGTARLYVDGAEYGNGATGGSININSVGAAAGSGGTLFAAGVLDEFAVYASELSSTRVAAHYTAGTTSTGPQSIAPSHLASSATVYAPTLVADQAVAPTHIASTATVYAPTLLDLGAVHPAFIASSAVVFAPTIDPTEIIVGEPEVNRAGAWAWSSIGEAKWSPAVESPVATAPPVQDVVAQAFTAPVIDGTHTLVEPTYYRETGHRDRILVNGRDITYWRGVPTPIHDFQRVQPLLHGAASFSLPQAVVPFETPGYGALSWLTEDAAVVIQRVDPADDSVVANDWVGNVMAFDLSGNQLRVECAGHATGRAATIDRQMQLVQTRADAGQWTAQAIRGLRLRHDPPLGSESTGIRLIGWGGGNMLDYINELVAKMTTVEGDSWTLMPDDNLTYRTELRDFDTIHGTVYLDDSRIRGELRRDRSEEHNRIFASGVDANGMVIKFGAYPGLIQGAAAPYPMNDNSAFGVGTTDADTDTGDGITIMEWRLISAGFLDNRADLDSFDAKVASAIKDLQRQAGLIASGTMTPGTWKALWNLSITGHDLRHIKILPAAEDPEVKPWRLSSNGSPIARNPSYKPSKLWSDRTVSMGDGLNKPQIRGYARGLLATGPIWRGTIEITTGAIVAGDHTPGDPITSILRARDIKPGMNLSLPLFADGIVVHVAGVSFTDNGRNATLAVSTQPGDTLPVWAAIQRDRENRNTVHRSFNQQRRSSSFERENTFDEVGGRITPLTLAADDWTIFPVVAKQAGVIEKFRLVVSPAREFVVAVFGRRISPGRLRQVTNAPLTVNGSKRWTDEAVRARLDRDHALLYVAGSDEDPCGYFPGRKSEGNTLNGKFYDDASFPYVTYVNDTDRGSVLWVAVWVPATTTLQGGRIMWPSAEEY